MGDYEIIIESQYDINEIVNIVKNNQNLSDEKYIPEIDKINQEILKAVENIELTIKKYKKKINSNISSLLGKFIDVFE